MTAIGNRIFTEIKRPSRELVEKFRGLPSSNINDEMNRLFCMHDYMKLLNPATSVQLLGTAITVKAPIGDNLFFHEALDIAQPGDIIVVSGHVGIISTDGNLIDASSSNGRVIERPLGSWWANNFIVGWRIF